MVNIIKMISRFNNSEGNDIQYIVVHDTGNTTDTAEDNAKYFNRANRDASAHYFVDDHVIYQVVEDNRAAWHCGDGQGQFGITNHNSIGIEMCRKNNNVTPTTENNTIALIKILMQKYNVDVDHVVRHFDASRKICPSSFAADNWQRWNLFKNKLRTTNSTQKWYKVQCGAFKLKNNAINLQKRLDEADFASYIKIEDTLYKIQVGAFTNKDNAYKLIEQLKKKGFNAILKIENVK